MNQDFAKKNTTFAQTTEQYYQNVRFYSIALAKTLNS